MNKYAPLALGCLLLLSALPASAQTGCMALCPTYANCVGECTIDAPEGSTCSAVCTATCSTARCQLFGGPECTEAIQEPCVKRPAKRVGRANRSPLESPWAVLEVDENSQFSTLARGVLAASTPEYGLEAWAEYWRGEYQREEEGSAGTPKVVRTVFVVEPVAYEPIEPRFQMADPNIRPALPLRSRFYFRGATRGDGFVVLVEPLYTTAPGFEDEFVRFVKEQFRVESLSMSQVPVSFYGSVYINSTGDVIRGTLNTTFISEANFERFGKQAY